ncbi:hypothetical protein [Planococcus soli]|uniref:hypothetical protein n=1 Tax=Planococcus soli TaxID=2666072 RepID=UPI00115E1417|nr:hypothetical protein [Planococcus soli]
MRQKIKPGVAILILASLAAVIWVFFNFQKDNRLAAEYIEEKYGMEVEIISETQPNFVDGHSYEMAFKEQEDLVFTVTEHEENYATIYRDDYKPLHTAYEAQQKAESLMPQFEELGFTAPPEGALIEQVVKNTVTDEAVRWLGLGTENSFETVELAEIETLTKLLELVREQNINVHIINVSNNQKGKGVAMDLREMDEVQSIEEVAAYINVSILSELGPAGERMQAKWQESAIQSETERFRFYDE